MAPHMKIKLKAYLKMPDQNQLPFQNTVTHKRKMYAQFGRDSGINPGIMWPTVEELRKKVAHENEWTETLQSMMEKVRLEKEELEKKTEERKQDILQKMADLPNMIKDVEDRRKKKEAETEKLRMKKQRMIDEIQQHFGYRIDPNDEKFQEMLAQKEKEEKKLEKEAKKKARIAREMDRLAKLAEVEAAKLAQQASVKAIEGEPEKKLEEDDKKTPSEEKDMSKDK
jgi:hypothetical protein